jgi:two-component system nitrate/nitrite response regulator NarL
MSIVELSLSPDVHQGPVKVVLADDECMFRTSLRHLLTAPPAVIKDVYHIDIGAGIDVVGEASTGEETITVVQEVKPELLLLDLSMPRMSGLDACRGLRDHADRMQTIILAGSIDRPQLLTAVKLGVRGFVLKDATTEVLFEAIMCVAGGQYWLGRTLVADLVDVMRSTLSGSHAYAGPGPRPALTSREREILALVAAGQANRDIATQLIVSEETVKHHLTRIFDKLGASNRLELARIAVTSGLLSDLPSS